MQTRSEKRWNGALSLQQISCVALPTCRESLVKQAVNAEIAQLKRALNAGKQRLARRGVSAMRSPPLGDRRGLAPTDGIVTEADRRARRIGALCVGIRPELFGPTACGTSGGCVPRGRSVRHSISLHGAAVLAGGGRDGELCARDLNVNNRPRSRTVSTYGPVGGCSRAGVDAPPAETSLGASGLLGRRRAR